ncbi:MAG: hypothetical protein Q8O15_08075 [Rectinemataceae bacterium]|nr:hypothetical protein [Rectinemataceae bacterium]
MNKGKIIQAIILSVLSLLSFVWNKYRSTKRLGKEIGTGYLIGVHTPYKYVFGVTNYTLSNITMIVICNQDKNYLLMIGYVINTLINLYVEIKNTSKIWNKVIVFENGIKINYEEIEKRKMVKIENMGDGKIKYTIKNGLEVVYDSKEGVRI